ncbi:hypothetical protein TNCV_2917821 [Trichonephila clavipes]|nr:hypothetical protein TNCV_2917821 [Trichonephila clavipes]
MYVPFDAPSHAYLHCNATCRTEIHLKRPTDATTVFNFVVGRSTVTAGLYAAVLRVGAKMVTVQIVNWAPDVFAMSVGILVKLKTSPLPDSRSVMLLYDPAKPT